MPYFALRYQVVSDYIMRRTQYRAEHLALAKAAHERGDLVMAGAFADPPDGALLIFRAADKTPAEQFAKSDPYVLNGLVAQWDVRPWTVVVGGTE
jgi:uncharacterized protein YciI